MEASGVLSVDTDSISYVTTSDRPSEDDIASLKINDKCSEDMILPRPHFLVLCMMI